MTITQKEVEHIASLARLGLSQSEIKKFQMELSSILKYVEKLEKVDISETEPTSHPLRIENATRPDIERENKSAKILELAPETKDGYFKVKSILK